jgi:hypothetical protein
MLRVRNGNLYAAFLSFRESSSALPIPRNVEKTSLFIDDHLTRLPTLWHRFTAIKIHPKTNKLKTNFMNRIQFFYDDDLIALELKINEWLSSNKEKKIVETNLNSIGKPSARAGITNTEKYIFYILYTSPEWENIMLEHKAEENINIDTAQQIGTKVGAALPN